MRFKLESPYKLTGDQPQAVDQLVKGIKTGATDQVLLGVTGSGKTFTVASVIEQLQLPTLVISHNKTLAGQLYQELRDFFPENGVSYFVSYYDYYQPEAYIPQTDTYIEKETDINREIDKLRLRATTNLMTRKDVITVASVSCIYNIGSPSEYGNFVLELEVGKSYARQ
ncbi:MAG: DEAD/DEAH box helicase family protein, partial [Candidatus Blackburnbacteria bacterium]|nr:DEAD/DEAH box helicase family protein [Candidatus Blackburnbacteria bacterium]